MNTSTGHAGPTWFPLFGTPVGANKWSLGTLLCGQAFTADAGHDAVPGDGRAVRCVAA